MPIITLPDGRRVDTDRIAQLRAQNPLNPQFLQNVGFNQPGGPVGPNPELLARLANRPPPGPAQGPAGGFLPAFDPQGGSFQTGGVTGGVGTGLPGQINVGPGVTQAPPTGPFPQAQGGGLAQQIADFNASLNTPEGRAAFEAIATPEQIAQVQQGVTGLPIPTATGGGGTGQPAPLPQAPPTGLIGGEQALLTGLEGSLLGLEEGVGLGQEAIQTGLDQALLLLGRGGAQLTTGAGAATQAVSGALDPALQNLQAFTGSGISAQQQQDAFAGLLGPEAQQQAFADFAASPGQEFLQSEAERALLRNQAAIGGLGGGNVRRALQEQAVGLGQQFFQQNFENLGQIAGRGLQGATAGGQLSAQEAGLLGNIQTLLGQGLAAQSAQGAGFAQQGGLAQGNILAQAGIVGGGFAQQAGRDIAQQRFQTGQDIAAAVSGTTSALSELAAAQGTGVADITGQGAANLANIQSAFGQLDAASQQALATILANLATQQGTQQAILQQGIGQATSAGITGQAAGLREGVLSPTAESGSALSQFLQLIT